ncbi:MAG: hypothetical protein VKN13_02785 [Cyanobacteriota bacterium]|nr:hypothetical protein [Cyanobacteriota bacterium]
MDAPRTMARCLLLAVLLVAPVRAQLGSQSGSNSASEARAFGAASNQQTNSSASQSYGGNNNTYQYNTEFGRGAEYGFSPRQLRCEGPRAFVGLWADPQADYWFNNRLHGQNSWEMRGGAGVTIPFGALNQTCQAMSLLLEQQLRFDTAIGMVRACRSLQGDGVVLEPGLISRFPALAACQELAADRPRATSASSQPFTSR